jgi:chromosomal replication initiation ATPase DnaA
MRTVRYSIKQNEENYFREQLMLYRPWRNEQNQMRNSHTFKEQFQNHSEDISNKRASYEKIESYLEDIMNSVNEERVEDIMDEVAPNDKQSSEIASEHSITSPDFPGLMRPENLQEYNMVQSTENSTSSRAVIPNRLSDRDYYQLMNSLNIQPEQFVHHISFLVKTNMLPFHIFLSGGAGVGKSYTIQAIFQTLTRYFDSTPENNPDFQRILIVHLLVVLHATYMEILCTHYLPYHQTGL